MPLYQRAFYITPSEPVEVLAVSAAAVALGSTLCVTPKTFAYNGYAGPGNYALTNEGLIGFMAADQSSPNWGAYADGGFRYITKPDGSVTPLTFMQAMAALTVYGLRDEGLSIAQQTNLMRYRKVALRCGYTSDLAISIAASVGLTCRRVQLLTLDTINGFDDGHVVLEAQEGSFWRFYDVPGDTIFRDPASGSILSIGAIVDRGVGNCLQEDLARHESFQQDYPTNGWATPTLDVFNEYFLASPGRRAAWRSRIYQIPGLMSGGVMYYALKPENWSRKAWLQNYQPGSVVLPWADWVAKFYPNGL